MKFHKQEHLVVRNSDGDLIQHGSCYPTVLACLLDLELHEVPYFHLLYWTKENNRNLSKYFENRYLNGQKISDFTGEEYQKDNFHSATSMTMNLWSLVFEYWLASVGYKEKYIEDIDQWLKENPNTPYLAQGKSSRGVDHIVIYMNGKLYHDPHPSDEGLIELRPENAFKILEKI
jgi:hypothetical protein